MQLCLFWCQKFRLIFNPWLQCTGGKIEQTYFSKKIGQFIYLLNLFYVLPMKIDFFVRYSLVL